MWRVSGKGRDPRAGILHPAPDPGPWNRCLPDAHTTKTTGPQSFANRTLLSITASIPAGKLPPVPARFRIFPNHYLLITGSQGNLVQPGRFRASMYQNCLLPIHADSIHPVGALRREIRQIPCMTPSTPECPGRGTGRAEVLTRKFSRTLIREPGQNSGGKISQEGEVLR